MSLWNGTLTSIAYGTQGCLTDAQAETTILVTFEATSATAVLAWGGHLAFEGDWSPQTTAGGIPGSPYHMRLKDWNLGNLGSQDLSLSADAVAQVCGDNIINQTGETCDGTDDAVCTVSGSCRAL